MKFAGEDARSSSLTKNIGLKRLEKPGLIACLQVVTTRLIDVRVSARRSLIRELSYKLLKVISLRLSLFVSSIYKRVCQRSSTPFKFSLRYATIYWERDNSLTLKRRSFFFLLSVDF